MMMKNSIFILCLALFSAGVQAQVAIGKSDVNGSATILDFAEGTTSGIILPRVESLPPSVGGTFVYDATDLKVKVYGKVLDENGNPVSTSWIALTDTQGEFDSAIQDDFDEKHEGSIIGASNSSKEGVLVLESSNKAMILPKIANPEVNVKSPEAGMMCYDTVTKNLLVYNGKEWYSWSID
ncbi:MAG: hypothetical protein C4K58_01455 [Flavobacteriaceae bacterium]|nr:MAG: hypothetical protein C4K58_01455 [Flavobacteriaceae bacterium]